MSKLARACREAEQMQIAVEEGVPEAKERLNELVREVQNPSDEPSGGDDR